MSDDLEAERQSLMAEQERLLRAGVPIEELARIIDHSTRDQASPTSETREHRIQRWLHAAFPTQADPSILAYLNRLMAVADSEIRAALAAAEAPPVPGSSDRTEGFTTPREAGA